METFFSENSGFYFLSSLLQANAAILSITGVFYIFKIQSLQSSIDIIKSSLMADMGRRSWPEKILEFDKLSLVEKEKALLIKPDPYIHIKPSIVDWTTLERKISNVKAEVKPSLIILGIAIIVEAVCLFTANLIHQHNMVEMIVLFLNLILEVIIVFVVIKNILKALN